MITLPLTGRSLHRASRVVELSVPIGPLVLLHLWSPPVKVLPPYPPRPIPPVVHLPDHHLSTHMAAIPRRGRTTSVTSLFHRPSLQVQDPGSRRSLRPQQDRLTGTQPIQTHSNSLGITISDTFQNGQGTGTPIRRTGRQRITRRHFRSPIMKHRRRTSAYGLHKQPPPIPPIPPTHTPLKPLIPAPEMSMLRHLCPGATPPLI